MSNNIKFGKHVGGTELKAMYAEIGELWEAAGNPEKAAQAYATGGVYDKAIGLFGKLGNQEKAKELQLEEKAVELALGGQEFAAMKVFDVYVDEGKPKKALEKVVELFGWRAEVHYTRHLKEKAEMEKASGGKKES